MAKETHLSVFLTRQIRIRREHVLNEKIEPNQPITKVFARGEKLTINAIVARDLILQESAHLLKDANDREAHEEFLKSLAAEDKTLKKAA